MANRVPHSSTSLTNDLHEDDPRNMLVSLVESLQGCNPTVVASRLGSNAGRDFETMFLAPPFDPFQQSSIPAYFPPLLHEDENNVIQSFREIVNHHYGHALHPGVAPAPSQNALQQPDIETNASNIAFPPQRDLPNGLAELQHSLDDAIAFIRSQQMPFFRAFDAAGCENWTRLLGHLSAIAWKYIAIERLRCRSPEFWEGELTRLYCEYLQKGAEFEAGKYIYRSMIAIQLQGEGGGIIQGVTRLDDKNFTDGLTTFLSTDIHRHVMNRLAAAGDRIVMERLQVAASGQNLAWTHDAIRWKGENEGFPLFHNYENVDGGKFAEQRVLYFRSSFPEFFLRWAFLPGNLDEFLGVFKEVTGPDGLSYLQPLRHLDVGHLVFGCSILLNCLDYAVNKPRKPGQVGGAWKNSAIKNASRLSEYVRKVIVGDLANEPRDVVVNAQHDFLRLATLDLIPTN